MNIYTSSQKRFWPALGLALAGWATGATAADIKLGTAGELEIKGDLRLRQESAREIGASTDKNKTSNRQRYRLRVGMNYKVSPQWSVKTQLASGTGEQTSTNQTLANNASQKPLFIDLAYLEFKPVDTLTLMGGRLKNNMWQPYAADIVWDTDYNPEGMAESVKIPVGSMRLFFNALQASINEDAAGSGAANKPQYLFSQQVGITFPAPLDSRVTLAGGLHDWVNERGRILTSTTTSVAGKQAGTNTLTNGILDNDFRVAEAGVEIFTSLPVIDLPLSVQGTLIKNTAHRKDLLPKDDTGYQWGGILGQGNRKNGWEAAYFKKSVGKDATVADVADSDFPGTNRVGDIYWLAYGVTDAASLKAKYFDTHAIGGSKKNIQRLQVDFQVKF